MCSSRMMDLWIKFTREYYEGGLKTNLSVLPKFLSNFYVLLDSDQFNTHLILIVSVFM